MPNGVVVLLLVLHGCEVPVGVPDAAPCERRGHVVVAAVQEVPVVNKPWQLFGINDSLVLGTEGLSQAAKQTGSCFPVLHPRALERGLKCRHSLGLPGGPTQQLKCHRGTGLCCHPIPAAAGMSSGCYIRGAGAGTRGHAGVRWGHGAEHPR